MQIYSIAIEFCRIWLEGWGFQRELPQSSTAMAIFAMMKETPDE
jgi:hypothetical protein